MGRKLLLNNAKPSLIDFQKWNSDFKIRNASFSDIVTIDNVRYLKLATEAAFNTIHNVTFKPNTRYNMTASLYRDALGGSKTKWVAAFTVHYSDGTYSDVFAITQNEGMQRYSFTTTSGKSVSSFRGAYDVNGHNYLNIDTFEIKEV